MGRRYYIPLRRRHDIPIRSRKDVPLRHLGDVPLRRHWVFHLRHTCDVAGTYRETSLRHHHNVVLPGGRYLSLLKRNLSRQFPMNQQVLYSVSNDVFQKIKPIYSILSFCRRIFSKQNLMFFYWSLLERSERLNSSSNSLLTLSCPSYIIHCKNLLENVFSSYSLPFC